MTQANIILASSSPFRKALLSRLQLEFSVLPPNIDESKQDNEKPETYVERLAIEKAQKVADELNSHEEYLIIGSDQCVVVDNVIYGKPGNFEQAKKQLENSSGKRLTFHTGLCLLNSKSNENLSAVVPFHVHFRELSEKQIERYLLAEEPYNCAGSFKSEGLGITLFHRLEGDDPNALIGLPLIKLTDFFTTFGVELP